MVFFIGALLSSIINFRGQLVNMLVLNGYKVTGMASGATANDINSVEQLDAEYIDYPVSSSGLNPRENFKTFKALQKIFKAQLPDVILVYTIKPIILGGLAACCLPNFRFYGLVTGLGFAFQKGNWKKNLLMKLVIFLYKVAAVNDSCVERTNFVFKPLNASSK